MDSRLKLVEKLYNVTPKWLIATLIVVFFVIGLAKGQQVKIYSRYGNIDRVVQSYSDEMMWFTDGSTLKYMRIDSVKFMDKDNGPLRQVLELKNIKVLLATDEEKAELYKPIVLAVSDKDKEIDLRLDQYGRASRGGRLMEIIGVSLTLTASIIQSSYNQKYKKEYDDYLKKISSGGFAKAPKQKFVGTEWFVTGGLCYFIGIAIDIDSKKHLIRKKK